MQKMETMTNAKDNAKDIAKDGDNDKAKDNAKGGDNDNEQVSSILTSVRWSDKFCDAFVQGCTTCGSLAAGLRENGERRRK